MKSRVATPILLFLTAIGVRILSWHSVFQRDGVYPNGNDAYYHLRRIRYTVEHFPDVLDFDPLINFPHGGQPIWPATFDWSIAALVRWIPGIAEPGHVERIVVCFPPLLGAASVVLVYLIGLRFFSRTVALVAGLSMAILPAHVLYSRIGALDHHVMVALCVAAMLWAGMALVEDRSVESGSELRVRASLGLGAAMAAAVLVWPGSLLQVGVLQVALLVRLLTADDAQAARTWAARFAVAHGAAFLLVTPFCVGHDWVVWSALSPVVLSNFQPVYFFAGFACFAGLGFVWRRGLWVDSRRARAGAAAAIGLVVLAGLFLSMPGLSDAIADALAWFSKDEEFQSAVNESVPLFGGPSGSTRAVTFLGQFVYVVPLLLGYAAWSLRRRAEGLLLVGWGAALFLATLVQWRFMNSYSIAHGLLLGIAFDACVRVVRGRLAGPSSTRVAVVGASAILALGVLPSLASYRLHLENWIRSARGVPTVAVGLQRHARFVADAARYLRDHSPATDPPTYSVLAPWGDGHILKTVAGRAVVQDNFGDDAAPENFRLAEAYFAARSEAEALEIVAPLDTRYVLVRSTGSGHTEGYAADSLFNRLYRSNGVGGRLPPRGERTEPLEFGPLTRHRLIYRSPPLDEARSRLPYCMLYEIVPGALIVGRAEPGAPVEARLAIEPRNGPDFVFLARTVADADGAYALRVPYSNASPSPDVRTGDHYNIRSGRRSAALIVPEAAVESGARVEAPALRG